MINAISSFPWQIAGMWSSQCFYQFYMLNCKCHLNKYAKKHSKKSHPFVLVMPAEEVRNAHAQLRISISRGRYCNLQKLLPLPEVLVSRQSNRCPLFTHCVRWWKQKVCVLFLLFSVVFLKLFNVCMLWDNIDILNSI